MSEWITVFRLNKIIILIVRIVMYWENEKLYAQIKRRGTRDVVTRILSPDSENNTRTNI